MNYTVPEAIKDVLLGYGYADGETNPVTDLLGKRLYPNAAPQTIRDEDPDSYATFRMITDVASRTLRGPSTLAEARMEITINARKYIDGQAIKEAIRERLDGFDGNVTGKNGSIALRGIRVDDIRDDYRFGDSSEDGWHVVTMDLLVWHTATAPLLVTG